MFGVYRNLDLSDKCFDYLLTVQFVDRKTYFVFVDHVNAHHEEWVGSSATNLHGRAVRDFVSLSACEQTVTKNTHIDGGVLGLVLTDIPDVIGVRVGSPIGSSNHITVFIDVILEQHIPHLVSRQEAFLNNSVD